VAGSHFRPGPGSKLTRNPKTILKPLWYGQNLTDVLKIATLQFVFQGQKRTEDTLAMSSLESFLTESLVLLETRFKAFDEDAAG
jgi:hypothetical protein